MLTDGQLRLLDAAVRHVLDAERLVDEEGACASPDQAWHLAGFGPECAWKACVEERSFDKVLGHELSPPGWVWSWVHALDPRGRRYQRLPGQGSPLRRWEPAHRYDRTGEHAQEAQELVREAAGIVVDVLAALWADGSLHVRRESGALSW